MANVVLHAPAASSALPLVLLAPFPFDARVWQPVVDLLDGPVITVDPPGFGGACDHVPSIDGYASSVLEQLDERGVNRFVVAGNSMGGYVALALAELAPGRVAGLGLLGTKATADSPDAAAGRLAMARKAREGVPVADLLAEMKKKLIGPSSLERDPSLTARLDELTASATGEGVAWAQRAMAARPDRSGVLVRFRRPSLVLHGDEDTLMPPSEQKLMAGALRVTPVILSGCGHLPELEAPQATADALADLWERARLIGS